MASPVTPLPTDPPLVTAKSQAPAPSPKPSTSPPVPVMPEKVQPEHATRSDPLGAHLIVKISDVDLQAADFFVPVATSSSHDLINRGPTAKPSIDYANDAIAALGLATNLNIHRTSQFFDHLTASRLEYEEKMQTYHLYAALRDPALCYSPVANNASDMKATRRSLQLDGVEQIRMHKDDSGFGRDPSSVDMPWTFSAAQTHILEVIKGSTVPKPKKKKKKKKKKKGKLPSPTPDILTPEEASLNYQIVVMEERIRQELLAYEIADKDCANNEELLVEIRKRYDQELQACKAEFLDEESELKALEDEWGVKIREAEATQAATEQKIADTVAELEEKIANEESAIADLQIQIAGWVRFREGPMLRNKAKIDKLIKAIAAQKQNREDHIRLTEEAVHLAEEDAKKEEEQAMAGLCQRHITEVCESLPPEEIQEIENNDILSAELTALTKIYDDLVAETDALQGKIIHQAASAQAMLESINMDNAKIAKNRIFNRKTTILKKLEDFKVTGDKTLSPDYVYQNFQDLHEVRGLTGGLTVVGTALQKKVGLWRTGTAASLTSVAKRAESTASTADLQPGFLLKVPTVNKAIAVKHTSLANQNPEFMDRLNNAITRSKQKGFVSERPPDEHDDASRREFGWC